MCDLIPLLTTWFTTALSTPNLALFSPNVSSCDDVKSEEGDARLPVRMFITLSGSQYDALLDDFYRSTIKALKSSKLHLIFFYYFFNRFNWAVITHDRHYEY